MTEAIHANNSRTTQIQSTDSTFPSDVVAEVTAAQLSAAGFAVNDEVFILAWSNNDINESAANSRTALFYGASEQLPGPILRHGAVNARHRNHKHFKRLNLGGTLQDIEYQISPGSGTAPTQDCEKAELFVIKAADFGTENTDWFWNEVISATGLTTTPVSFASVAITPPSTQDYVAVAWAAIDATTANSNAVVELMVDGVVVDVASREPENSAELLPFLFIRRFSLTSGASRTVEIRCYNDSASAHEHEYTRLLVFKASTFPDLYFNGPADGLVSTATDTQIATVTNTLSEAQNCLIIGTGVINIDTVDIPTYLWGRSGGADIEPDTDGGTGFGADWSYDATDEVDVAWVAYASLSGTLDIDLMLRHTAGGNRSVNDRGLLVWGMKLGAAPEQKAASDSFALSEAVNEIGLSVADSASLTEVSTSTAETNVSDSAALTDVPTEIGLSSVDSYSFTDTLTSFDVDVSVSDSPSLTEAISIEASSSPSDTFTLSSEIGSIDADREVFDTFTLSEVSDVDEIMDVFGNDSATLTETSQITEVLEKVASDSFSLTEVSDFDSDLSSSDSATLSEASQVTDIPSVAGFKDLMIVVGVDGG